MITCNQGKHLMINLLLNFQTCKEPLALTSTKLDLENIIYLGISHKKYLSQLKEIILCTLSPLKPSFPTSPNANLNTWARMLLLWLYIILWWLKYRRKNLRFQLESKSDFISYKQKLSSSVNCMIINSHINNSPVSYGQEIINYEKNEYKVMI